MTEVLSDVMTGMEIVHDYREVLHNVYSHYSRTLSSYLTGKNTNKHKQTCIKNRKKRKSKRRK